MKRKAAGLKRRAVSLLLAAAILTQQADFTVFGAEQAKEAENVIYIHNEGEFQILADQCRTESFSTGKTFYLKADLDFSELENLFIPMMNGNFEGGGHQITNVTLNEEMSDYGLFRYVGENGLIRDLTVEAKILTREGQENVGIIAGSNSGTIMGCVSRGSISGQAQTGGIVGRNKEQGTISHSQNEAQIDGKVNTGGIAGNNEGTISDCSNNGPINTNQKVKKEMDGDGSVHISIPNAVAGLTKDERANQTGGIAGISSGSIAYCTNEGTVGYEHLGSSTGGIVGRQNGSVSYSQNMATIYGRKNVGGIVGYFDPYEATSYDRNYRDELKSNLDDLSDAFSGLQNVADQMGTHLSDNLDVLSDQLKTFRDSIRSYLDRYSSLAEADQDDIEDDVSAIKGSINGMQYNLGLEAVNGYLQKIWDDVEAMQGAIDALEKILDELSKNEGVQAEVKKLKEQLAQYKAILDEIVKTWSVIQEIIKGITGGGGQGGTPGTHTDSDNQADSSEQTDSGEDNAKDAEDDSQSGSSQSENLESNENSSSTQQEGEQQTENNSAGTENPSESTVSPDSSEDLNTEQQQDNINHTQSQDSSEPDEPQQESAPTQDSQDSQADSPENLPDSTEEPNAEQPSGEEANHSTGRGMTYVSYTMVSSTENPSSSLIPEQVKTEIKNQIGIIEASNADIQKQMQGLMTALNQLPGEANKFTSDLKKLKDRIYALDKTIRKNLDNWSEELDYMRSDLKGKGNGISDSLDSTGDALDSDWDRLFDSLDRVKHQFTSMRVTLSDSLDDLKDRIEDRTIYADISELLLDESGEGRVLYCENSGEIYADSQGGGIAGSISKEEIKSTASGWIFSFDEEDEDKEEEKSITHHVQAAILHCVNTSQISVTNDYAGGIVGKADYGVIRDSENYADVVTEDGSYVGGIAGRSDYAIRDCYILGGISGQSYVGGVAGRGENISGNYVCSYLEFSDHQAKCAGEIVGKADGKVENNYFVDNGYGAVDGVTREQEAVGVDYPSMLELKELPKNFTEFTVRFIDEGEVIWEDTFSYGDSLETDEYPKLKAPNNGYVYWEEKNLAPINRNVTVHALYRAYIPSLSSDKDSTKPELMFGGEFYPDTKIVVQKATEEEEKKIKANFASRPIFGKLLVKQVYHYEITQKEELRKQVSVRVLDQFRGNRLSVLKDNLEENDTQKTQVVGSYLGVNAVIDKSGYVVVLHETYFWMVLVVALGILLLVLFVFWLIKKKRRQIKEEIEEIEETKAIEVIEETKKDLKEKIKECDEEEKEE